MPLFGVFSGTGQPSLANLYHFQVYLSRSFSGIQSSWLVKSFFHHDFLLVKLINIVIKKYHRELFQGIRQHHVYVYFLSLLSPHLTFSPPHFLLILHLPSFLPPLIPYPPLPYPPYTFPSPPHTSPFNPTLSLPFTLLFILLS